MSESRCEWVRARLPLAVGELGGDDGREQSDLSLAERAKIDGHLEHCAECRGHLAWLKHAVEALITMGREPSAAVPSLWPALERRIREHESVPVTSWSGRLADRWTRFTAPRREEHPLRSAWIHDTLRETKALIVRLEPESRRTARWVVSLAAAAGLLIAVLPFLGRGPMIEPPAASPVVDRIESPDPPGQNLAQDPSDDDEADSPVAHADSPRAGTSSGIASASPPGLTRLGNDLDNPIARPIDPRDAKPAY